MPTRTKPQPATDLAALLNTKKGIFLDIGCSDHKSPGAVGMDIRPLPGVDIVHDMTVIPWPLPDACCLRILASHILEHIPPDRIFPILDECWRIMQPNGQLLIAMPYANSPRAMQDPSHYRCWNEACCQYYDPQYPLFNVYRPRPWKVELNEWQSIGDISIIMAKRTIEDAARCAYWGEEHASNGRA